ncbi:hypothetical protein [Thiocystis violacea]|uniref:hypothetical protein n=1 Tax=Thiocystis violacea TaxID=13725 RepID=UPI001907992D|nr:hypothetical protein [Thiocystis violacea]MBK1720687.1 hypothetical protein [Thiocystis violacea]
MAFVGVLPERRHLFQPQPMAEVAVSDAAAWRLNPNHRQVYNKLDLALSVGLVAAPCGVDPGDLGVAADAQVFVKPILNLAGMSLNARAVPAAAVPNEAGSFWCERLRGSHTSSDCLVREGRAVWFAHTQGSEVKDAERSVYWDVGVALPALEPWLADWVADNLAGYTGLCNIEMIGGRPIEVHLRGSNGFFDLYGSDFLPAWVALVDGHAVEPPPPIPGGLVISIFGGGELDETRRAIIEAAGVDVHPDPHSPDRMAVLRCHDKATGRALCDALGLVPGG